MVLGLIEHDRGTVNPLSLEMLTLGRSLATELNASLETVCFPSQTADILSSDEVRQLAELLPTYGVTGAHFVQHERLDNYAPEAWAESVVQILEALDPVVVMAAGSDRGNEVMAHVAARMELPMAANCTEIRPGDVYQIVRVRWGGSLLEAATLEAETKLVTIAPHMVAAEAAPEAGELALNLVRPQLDDKVFRVRVAETVGAAGDKVSLADARVVVGGGRGVGSGEGFESLEELAHLLGGVVGCSRVVTNQGWRPHADQVGQTGMRIAPDLYIACGISGAIQHMVGCKGSKHILAINTDPEAPIMSKADYAVIGDLHEVVPAVVEEIRRVTGT